MEVKFRQIQFQFDPQRLVQYGVSVEEVIAAARQASGVRGAGFVETPNHANRSANRRAVAYPCAAGPNGAGPSQRSERDVGEVARAADAPAPTIGASSIGGNPGVILIVDAAYGSNTLEVTRVSTSTSRPAFHLEAQGISVHPKVFRAADFIDVALHNVRDSLLIGAVLVS